MVKNYSLPTTAAAAAAPSSKAPAAAQDEGGKADEQDQGGNAGRRGKRGRRSHLHSSPSPVKRPRDAVAPGDELLWLSSVVDNFASVPIRYQIWCRVLHACLEERQSCPCSAPFCPFETNSSRNTIVKLQMHLCQGNDSCITNVSLYIAWAPEAVNNV